MTAVKSNRDAAANQQYRHYLDLLDPAGTLLSEQGRARLLDAFGALGTYPHELLPAIRQTALGNQAAEQDLRDILAGSASNLIWWLRNDEGQTQRLAAENAFTVSQQLEATVDAEADGSGEGPRLCWSPVLDTDSAPGPQESHFGGKHAWLQDGADWPLYSDGGPMTLVFQFDLDTIPKPMVSRLGAPGHLLQLFVPTREDRGPQLTDEDWIELRSAFEVRLVAKSTPGHEAVMPPRHIADIGSIPVARVDGWQEQADVPFDDDENEQNVWGDKLGGWPSLEQGDQFPKAWDHVVQLVGGGVTKDEVAFDGHGWLVRAPDGSWGWSTVSS